MAIDEPNLRAYASGLESSASMDVGALDIGAKMQSEALYSSLLIRFGR